MSLDHLITDNLNTGEMVCPSLVREPDYNCSSLQCFNTNSFPNRPELRIFAEEFNLWFLPCTKPSPSLWLLIRGVEDLNPHNFNRTIVLNRNVTKSESVELPVTSGDITFGVYHFTVNFSEDYYTVGIAVS